MKSIKSAKKSSDNYEAIDGDFEGGQDNLLAMP